MGLLCVRKIGMNGLASNVAQTNLDSSSNVGELSECRRSMICCGRFASDVPIIGNAGMS